VPNPGSHVSAARIATPTATAANWSWLKGKNVMAPTARDGGRNSLAKLWMWIALIAVIKCGISMN